MALNAKKEKSRLNVLKLLDDAKDAMAKVITVRSDADQNYLLLNWLL